MLTIDHKKCIRCAGCVSVCPLDALVLAGQIECDHKKCTRCGTCMRFCPVGALSIE